MQSFLWAALAIIVFAFAVAAQNTCKPAGQFTGKTERGANDTSITASPLCTKDSAVLNSYMAIKEACFTVKHFALGDYKMGDNTAGDKKVSFGSAELPLEYLAVQ